MHTENNNIFHKGQDSNEEECFECGKGGRLSCCDICPKSFHQGCKELKKKQNGEIWECYYCYSQRNCQFCNESTANSQTKVCTICRLTSHKQCIDQYIKVPTQLINQTLLKDSTYVCKMCLNKYGIINISQNWRSCKFVNFVLDEQLIALVQIKYKSPIHYGYFKEKDIQEVFQLKLKEKKNKKIKCSHNSFSSYQSYKVEKILQIKVPKDYQKLDNNSLIKKLFGREATYGMKDNYQFLIKWEGADYEYCTWEDQYTLRKLDQSNLHLENFINKHKINETKGKEQTLKECMDSKNIEWNPLIEQQKIVRMAKLSSMFRLMIIQEISNEIQIAAINICYLLNHIYLVQQQNNSSIIVVSEDHFSLWAKQLKTSCSSLNIVNFHGSEKSIQILKKKQIGKFYKQVIITTFQLAIKHSDFFQEKMKIFAFAIVDSKFFSRGKKLNKMSRNVIVLQYNKWTKNEGMIEQYRKEYIIKHKMDLSNLHIIVPQMNPSELISNKNIVEMVNIRQQKRLAIIRYILRYGLQIQNYQSFYSLLHQFQPQVFHLPLSQENALLFKKYINSLIMLMSLHNQIKVSSNITKYYFSSINPSLLLIRIANIHRLRKFAKGQVKLEIKDSEIKNKNSKNSLGIFSSWKKDDDFILANLVLQNGYDNWKQILESRTWKKYSQLQRNLQSNRLNFMDYIKTKCAVQFKGGVGNIQQFMKMRIQMILQVYNE